MVMLILRHLAFVLFVAVCWFWLSRHNFGVVTDCLIVLCCLHLGVVAAVNWPTRREG